MDSIAKQWDFGVTAVASVDKLYGMIRAVSEDNVQGQATLAIMALGAGLSIDDKLIGTGVDALGGQNNVKIQNMKIAIGLFSGGTASILRASTPGVKAFLLLVGLKMWQRDEDVGDILYNMAISTGVMKSYPASGYQFAQVVSALSGHAGSILPAKHLHTVGERIMSFCNSGPGLKIRPRLFGLVSAKSIADLLTKVFTGLQNKDISRVTLHGDVSGIWIVAILTWLLPDETCVQLGSQLIIGEGTKLLIQLTEQGQERGDCDWDYVEWTEEKSVKSLIECSTFANSPPGSTVGGYNALGRMSNSGVWIPWTACKSYIQSTMNISPDIIVLVGQLAGALVRYIVENGKIHSHAYEDEDGACTVPPSTTTILDLSGDFFVRNYGSIMLEFGWSKEDLHHDAGKLAIEFMRILAAALPQATFPVVENAMTEAMMDVHKLFTHPKLSVLEDCVSMAIELAVVALSLMSHQPITGEIGRTHTPTTSFASYKQHRKLLNDMLTFEGVDIHDFRQNLLKTVTSGNLELDGDELIVQYNGIVIVPAMLLEPSTKKSQALGLHLIPGTIKKDKHRYTVIREMCAGLFTKGREAPLQLFEQGNYCGVSTKSIKEDQRPELEILMTIKGQTIYIRPVLIFQPQKGLPSDEPERDLCWLRAIENLATAKHLCRMDQLSPRAEEILARRLFEDGTLEDTFWIKSFSGEGKDYIHSTTRLITCSRSAELLRIYQASIPRDCVYVLQHEASLIKAIAIAGEMSKNWVIIT